MDVGGEGEDTFGDEGRVFEEIEKRFDVEGVGGAAVDGVKGSAEHEIAPLVDAGGFDSGNVTGL